jgi:hypothetical protein
VRRRFGHEVTADNSRGHLNQFAVSQAMQRKHLRLAVDYQHLARRDLFIEGELLTVVQLLARGRKSSYGTQGTLGDRHAIIGPALMPG